MLPEDVYFKTLDKEELWKRYCGFLDLTVEEFLQIQRTLLAEQLSLVADSTLGRRGRSRSSAKRCPSRRTATTSRT
jgi:hypothetical protein